MCFFLFSRCDHCGMISFKNNKVSLHPYDVRVNSLIGVGFRFCFTREGFKQLTLKNK